jgi:hypothetical protein
LPKNPFCTAIATTGNILYAAFAQNGVYKSTDFGATWSLAGTNIQYGTFISLLADGNDIYASDAGGGFYYSGNAGDTWIKKGENLQQIRNFFVSGDNLFLIGNVAGLGAIYKSTDKGSHLCDGQPTDGYIP